MLRRNGKDVIMNIVWLLFFYGDEDCVYIVAAIAVAVAAGVVASVCATSDLGHTDDDASK
jgi:hypothetical protein